MLPTRAAGVLRNFRAGSHDGLEPPAVTDHLSPPYGKREHSIHDHRSKAKGALVVTAFSSVRISARVLKSGEYLVQSP